MGDPTEPGEDQETTIIIEGPPADADKKTKDEYKCEFEKFKAAVRSAAKEAGGLKVRLKKIEYKPKEK
jgi:hypothetical protein